MSFVELESGKNHIFINVENIIAIRHSFGDEGRSKIITASDEEIFVNGNPKDVVKKIMDSLKF